jgi:hypothetical protein
VTPAQTRTVDRGHGYALSDYLGDHGAAGSPGQGAGAHPARRALALRLPAGTALDRPAELTGLVADGITGAELAVCPFPQAGRGLRAPVLYSAVMSRTGTAIIG